MALDRTAATRRVRELVAEITNMKRVYAPSENDENAFPAALKQFPCAIVRPGSLIRNVIGLGSGERRDYEIIIEIFESGPDIGSRAYSVLPFADLVCDKFMSNVALGGRVNGCRIDRDSGFTGLEYAGADGYSGYQIFLAVSEAGNATPGFGA